MGCRKSVFVAAALLTGQAFAQPPSASPGPPAGHAEQQAPPGTADAPAIVVEGRRDTDRQISELINHLPHTQSNGHFARFEQATCPAAIGLTPNQADFVVSRMRKVAAAAGVPVSRPGCRINVLVAVVAQKRLFIEQLAKRFPAYLGDLSSSEVRRLEKDPAPTALWRMTETVGSDGRDLTPTSIEGVSVNRTTSTGSRLRELAHPAVAGSILVVEAAALAGVTTTQLADYAVMRTLTGVDPAGMPADGATTILTVLDTPVGGQMPITITQSDMAFIKSLYESNPSLYAPAQSGEIRSRMRKTLKASEPPGTHH